MAGMRVVSLLPSATEMCYALGIEPVGVSHECDYPPPARDLPTVLDTRIDADATSTEIDEQVQAAVEDGGVFELDREQLAALDPDVILSQGVCEVCAVDDTVVRQAVADLGLGADVVTTDPHSLSDLFADIERLGGVFGCEQRAESVVSTLQARVRTVENDTPETGPRVVILDWLDPVMVAGHWIPGMVERLGGAYGLARPGDASRPREWDEIREYDPEVLIAAPCGFDTAQTRANLDALTTQQGWRDLRAVENDRVYLMDGDAYVNRPGPRLVDTLELLADVVHGSVETATPAVEQLTTAQNTST